MHSSRSPKDSMIRMRGRGSRVAVQVTVDESVTSSRVASLPMAHVSIEVGHLYAEDFAAGPKRVLEMARGVAPWVEAVRRSWSGRLDRRHPLRASTCLLIDDYFTPFSTPDVLVPMIVNAYAEAGLPLDYVARESACAHTGLVPLAELVLDQIVEDPPPGSDGSNRPDAHVSGWLANGKRSPAPTAATALGAPVAWAPPSQNAVNRHSVFIDVQLWDGPAKARRWSCPYLASIWQLLRLGVLRYRGEMVTEPVRWSPDLPVTWEQFPAVVQIQPEAPAFSAYQTFSVLDSRFLSVEHGVRATLSQVLIDPTVQHQIISRARREKLVLAELPIDRISYAFI